MFVSITFRDPLNVDSVAIEDELEEEFASDGENTGGGTGEGICHIDMEVRDDLREVDVVNRVRKVLAALGLGIKAEIEVEGKSHMYTPGDG